MSKQEKTEQEQEQEEEFLPSEKRFVRLTLIIGLTLWAILAFIFGKTC